jgi:uncharacterized protein (TIGR00255 family)
MRSMTGFGTGESTAGNVTVVVELRSVNHRFLDLSVKLPLNMAPLETDIRAMLKERLARGRISCATQLSLTDSVEPVVLDSNRLAQGLALLDEAASRLEETRGQRPEVQLEHVLAIPDLFRTEEVGVELETVRDALMSALSSALTQLQDMKSREGQELAADLSQRLTTLRKHLDTVEQLAPQAASDGHEKLRERINQLVGEQVDPQRLAQEAAILADRCNINEECERLAIHLEQFKRTLADGGTVGKRLNFLLQEMHREVNTMGSKTNLMDITQLVIAMKDEIESMREQVQNLE